MKLHHLTHFVAIAENASLHRAATALGIAQSALSRSLQELEASLGVALVQRSRRGTRLTGAGERFAARARSIQSELRRGQEEAAQLAGHLQGAVTIALAPSMQTLIVPQVLARFRRRWPDIRLTILDGLAEQFEGRIRDGSVDAYIGACALKPLGADLSETHLGRMDLVVACKAGSRWLGSHRLADLARANWVQARVNDRGADDLAAAFANNGLVPPTPIAIAAAMPTVFLLMQAADALAVVPRSWVAAWPGGPTIDRLVLEDPVGAINVCRIQRPDIPPTPAAQMFLDLASEAVREGVGG